MQSANTTQTSPWPKVLAVAACMCTAASLSLAFWSGCAADLKGGTWGNFDHALKIEAFSLPLDILAILFMCTAFAVRPGRVTEQRVAIIFAVGLLSVFAFALIGMQVQIWGTQSCH